MQVLTFLRTTYSRGFKEDDRVLTNLLEYTEIISKWVDDGSPVYVLYIDCQKAFDKVAHQTLLIKLKSHGMGVNIVTWIQNRLTNRTQKGKCGRRDISMDCSTQRGASRFGTGATTLPH